MPKFSLPFRCQTCHITTHYITHIHTHPSVKPVTLQHTMLSYTVQQRDPFYEVRPDGAGL